MVQPRKFPTYQNICHYQMNHEPSTSMSLEFPRLRSKSGDIKWTKSRTSEPIRDIPRVNVMLRTTTLPKDERMEMSDSDELSEEEMNRFMDSLPDPPSLPIHSFHLYDKRWSNLQMNCIDAKPLRKPPRIIRIPIDHRKRQEIEFTSAPRHSNLTANFRNIPNLNQDLYKGNEINSIGENRVPPIRQPYITDL